MTEAEALDMAARAAGWGDYNIALYNDGDVESIRAHATTIMENAENARLLSMSAEREINLRGELLRLQRKNAALKAENERLREALGEISRRTGLLIHQNTGRWDMRLEHDKRTVGVLTVNQRIARAALKEIEGD